MYSFFYFKIEGKRNQILVQIFGPALHSNLSQPFGIGKGFPLQSGLVYRPRFIVEPFSLRKWFERGHYRPYRFLKPVRS